MKKIYLIPVLALLLSCTTEVEKEKMNLRIDSLEANLNELKIENDSLEKEISLQKNRNSAILNNGPDSLENLETFIVESLEKNTQLIPEESVLGGTMRFVDIEILNERFIWAAYEDGHVAGEAIFQYKIKEADSIDFNLVSEIKD